MKSWVIVEYDDDICRFFQESTINNQVLQKLNQKSQVNNR